jgi:hypothetical protein
MAYVQEGALAAVAAPAVATAVLHEEIMSGRLCAVGGQRLKSPPRLRSSSVAAGLQPRGVGPLAPRGGLSSARPARDAGGMRLWVVSIAGGLRPGLGRAAHSSSVACDRRAQGPRRGRSVADVLCLSVASSYPPNALSSVTAGGQSFQENFLCPCSSVFVRGQFLSPEASLARGNPCPSVASVCAAQLRPRCVGGS